MLTPIAKKPVTRKKPFPAFLNQYIMVDGQKDDVDTTRRRRGAARNGTSVMHVYSWVTGCVHVYSIFWTYRLSRLYAGTMKVPELEDQEVEISIYHYLSIYLPPCCLERRSLLIKNKLLTLYGPMTSLKFQFGPHTQASFVKRRKSRHSDHPV